jgi:polyisoprenoid-binding protein YceI
MKLICVIILITSLFSQSYEIKNGSIEFLAKAELVAVETDLIGKGKGLNGSVDLTNKTFILNYDLWKLDTGIKMRNTHMHENHLESEEFPLVKYSGTIEILNDSTLNIKGVFELHGKKKDLTLKAKIKNKRVTAEWKLNIKDYGIDVPTKFLVAKMSEELAMKVDFVLEEKK